MQGLEQPAEGSAGAAEDGVRVRGAPPELRIRRRQPDALDTLLTKHNVQLRQFSNEIVKEIARHSAIVVNELANSDPYAKKVWDSYREFARKSVGWAKIGIQGYLNARAEYMNFG